MKKYITILLLALLTIGCTSTQEKTDPSSNTIPACDIECDGEDLDNDIDFKEITMDQAIQFFENKQTGVLYFGFEKCPWCQEAKPILYDVAKTYDVEINYIKTRDDDKNLLYTDEQKEIFTPYLKDYMSNNDDGVLTLFVPVVIYVKDGTIVDGHVGTFDEHDAHERKMTDDEQKRLKDIYISIFEQMK